MTTETNQAIKFSDHLSFDAFFRYLDFNRTFFSMEDEAAKAEWCNKLQGELEITLYPAIIGFLTDLKRAGLVNEIRNSNGYATNFTIVWNKLAAIDILSRSLRDYEWDVLTEFFFSAINHQISIRAHVDNLRNQDYTQESTAEVLRRAYVTVTGAITAGNFAWTDLPYHEKCHVTGIGFMYEFENWQGTLGSVKHEPNVLPVFVPAKPVNRPRKPLHRTIVFKTGNLLIADWFRIDAFTKYQDLPRKDRPNINSEVGREQMTDYRLQKGFISIHVGNSSPTIFKRDDTLVFGYEDDLKEPPFERYGSVCTDLWNVTIIDEADLLSILMAEHGDAGREIFEDYLKKNGEHITKLKLTPGTYHLYFHGHESIHAVFRSPDLSLEGLSESFFVLSPVELALEEAPATLSNNVDENDVERDDTHEDEDEL